MFFILSKILTVLIYPLSWIVILLVCAVLFKQAHLRKKCLLTALVLLIFFSTPFFVDSFAKWWDIDQEAADKKYSCAIVLGGFVSEDEQANGFFNSASDRFLQAVALKNSGATNYLLFSGGNADLKPSGFREAEWLSQQLSLYKIPDSTVIIEKESRNTLENVTFSKRLLTERNLKPPYLLVTSAFHMRRSLLTFNNMGLDVEPHACHYIAGRDKLSGYSFIPDAGVLSKWNFYIKEVVGYVVYSWKS